jgi:DNA-binding XRE family transcriptional regulator
VTCEDEGQLAEARAARATRAQAAEGERAALARAVAALREAGASQRDAALLLGISHQRVSQISAADSGAAV